jgi:hypothetical protein
VSATSATSFKAFSTFFAAATNSTYATNKAGSTSPYSIYLSLDVYDAICGILRQLLFLHRCLICSVLLIMMMRTNVGAKFKFANELFGIPERVTMEEHALKNVNNCLNTNIYSYLETSGGQSSNLYFKVVYFFSTSVNQTSVAA